MSSDLSRSYPGLRRAGALPEARPLRDAPETGKEVRGARLLVLPLGPREEGLLLAQVRAGDPEAFALLYHHFVGRVLGLARQILREGAAAQDATQETFLRVFRSIDRFRGESSLATWIHRIAVNICMSEVARRQRRSESPLADEPIPGASDERASGQATSHGCELRVSLEQLLGRLTPERRLVFYLCHVEGLSAAEIAQVTGDSVDAVHKRLQRARRQLLALWTGADEASPGQEGSPSLTHRTEGGTP